LALRARTPHLPCMAASFDHAINALTRTASKGLSPRAVGWPSVGAASA
jgi:hypothetical protein